MSQRRNNELIDEIWADDLLDRKVEAKLLVNYIESVAQRKVNREDARAFTIAIDTAYGEGKTFFLRRFSKHLAINHPVAFIDAWADNLADEPLVALLSTLKKALEPATGAHDNISDQWSNVIDKSGKVAAIVAKGLVRRGVGFLITAAAAEAAEAVLLESTEDDKDKFANELEKTGVDTIKGISKVNAGKPSDDSLEERIRSFEAGKAAIFELKSSLEALIRELEKSGVSPPVVIIIDELDRCRPTYAVKLLEEIKHLFDVPGLVFVFGMNGVQLGHSLAGEYGHHFDGKSYLRRFIQREYRLKQPDLEPLVQTALRETAILERDFVFPPVRFEHESNGDFRQSVPLAKIIAKYMEVYGLTARDTFQVIDMLETCVGMAKPVKLVLGYLLPLILLRIQGKPANELETYDKVRGFEIDDDWEISDSSGRSGSVMITGIKRLAANYIAYSKSTLAEINQRNRNDDTLSAATIFRAIMEAESEKPITSPANYTELLEMVGRFSDPQFSEYI